MAAFGHWEPAKSFFLSALKPQKYTFIGLILLQNINHIHNTSNVVMKRQQGKGGIWIANRKNKMNQIFHSPHNQEKGFTVKIFHQ